jgi:hypothetical protein
MIEIIHILRVGRALASSDRFCCGRSTGRSTLAPCLPKPTKTTRPCFNCVLAYNRARAIEAARRLELL